MATEFKTSLVPQVGSSEVGIPITLDYNGGRSQNTKSAYLWSIVALVVIVGITFGIIFAGGNLLLHLLIAGLFFYAGTWCVRRFLLHEARYRKEMMAREENDFQISMSNFWGITHITDDNYCYFRNGFVGLFIQFDKGPIVGKTIEDEFDHYSVVADAYSYIGNSRMRVCHIDLMDFIGRDSRIKKASDKLLTYENKDMRNLLQRMFDYRQRSAEHSVTSYDIYLFLYKGSEEEFTNELSDVVACMTHKKTNYVSYTILNRAMIRSIVLSLFNLHNFSIYEAMREAFITPNSAPVLQVLDVGEDGEKFVFNLSTEEAAAEAAAKSEEAAIRKAELNRRKQEEKARKKGLKVSDSDILDLDSSEGELDLDYAELDLDSAESQGTVTKQSVFAGVVNDLKDYDELDLDGSDDEIDVIDEHGAYTTSFDDDNEDDDSWNVVVPYGTSVRSFSSI